MSIKNLGIGLARIRMRTWKESWDIQLPDWPSHSSLYSSPRPNIPLEKRCNRKGTIV